MKRLFYSVGALFVVALMTIALAYAVPAAWMAQHVAGATGGRVQLARVSGFWHRGSGIVVLSSGSGGSDAAHWEQRVHWDVTQIQWPATWELSVTWPELGPPLRLTLSAGLSRWDAEITPWRGVIPLTALAGFGAPFNTVALEGNAHVSLSELRFSSSAGANPTPVSNVEITIAGLRSQLAQGVVLGDYRLRGKAGAAGGTFELSTVQGTLLLDGIGQCRVKNRLSCSFEGTARAAQHDDALLGNLLGLLGKQQVQSSSKIPFVELRW